ncbi:hypothetical protein PTSG_05654 [Salpingoeca rosetta]|uniref:tRNA pseudouridine(55) synthase n=1 Tax=Salpingoeca rosetta (strain ATCC 50818 / BSB-021) TaxID=946362 RepID=F2UBU4_SALR5|nr:uncharacterized protein PTSG_05654 [Salpingoeca rosetta]EGD73960.1 hypothetical protein PTSG_05654 [Salpingoeca rosetta]|eukprot:XP_004993523.1 hypothetical protein PTSG_05654 [Salpingoeca rosetta]
MMMSEKVRVATVGVQGDGGASDAAAAAVLVLCEGCRALVLEGSTANIVGEQLKQRLHRRYASADAEIAEDAKEEQKQEGDDSYDPTCCFCMGVLKYCTDPALGKLLMENLKASEYDSTSMDVGITLPLSWLVRERIINLHLDMQGNTRTRASLMMLKDVVRICVQAHYQRARFTVTQQSPLQTIVFFEVSPHPQSPRPASPPQSPSTTAGGAEQQQQQQQQHEEEEKDGCSRSGGGGGGGDGEKGMEGVEGGGSRAPRRHGRAHCHDDGSQSGQNNGEEIIVSEELRVLTQLRSHMFRPRRARRGRKKPSAAHNQASIAQALEDLSDGEIKRWPRTLCVPPLPAVATPTVTVKYTHAPIFIGGRYNKLVRGVSQTPWFIGSGRRGDTSVQELVTGELEALVKTDEVKFSSAGREDCDVRMLGTGRPFVLEFVNPRRIAALTADVLAQHQADVNGMEGSKVRVRDLRLVDKSDVALLHEGQEKKKKTYACPIWTETPLTQQQMDTINSTQDLLLHQKTPMRVCHRRTLMTRERLVHRMHIQPLKPHFYLLELCTQSGTYIKEFVHGDLGRTTPNMRSILGCNVDILSLDVVDVDLAWPPKSASSSSPAPAPVQAQERAQEAAS